MKYIPTLAHQIDDWLDMGINPIIVILAVPVFLLLAWIAVTFIISRYTYRCTECGEVFKPKFFKTHAGVHDFDGRELYCPKCKKKTWCKYHKN